MDRLLNLPLIVILMGVGAAAMAVPAAHGALTRDWAAAETFVLSGLFFGVITVLLGLATQGHRPRALSRSHLMALVLALTVLPAMLAVPFWMAVPATTFLNAWVEMVSSLTTTGISLFEPARLPEAVHLWRALVGWLGGYLAWVAALAILAPMNLGGFEVTSSAGVGAGIRRDRQIGLAEAGDPRARIVRQAWRLLPIYAGLTGALLLGLLVLGERPFVAACHAMSVMATSGISPVGGLEAAQAGVPGEVLIFAFLVFAITRVAYLPERGLPWTRQMARDPEARIAAILVVSVPLVLFLRHWIAAFEVDMVADLGAALRALWGAAFSVLSFLSSTGFLSAEWQTARAWSGLETPGIVLLGLGLIGGGVATTAGGVKLLRVYALAMHGARELEKLIHPSSVGGAGAQARRIRRQGAYISWIFFMLFALSLAAVSSVLAATGVDFDAALVLAVASLSTTGPVAGVVLEVPVSPAGLDDLAKTVLAFAMVLGRLETLAIIALLNPEFWRN